MIVVACGIPGVPMYIHALLFILSVASHFRPWIGEKWLWFLPEDAPVGLDDLETAPASHFTARAVGGYILFSGIVVSILGGVTFLQWTRSNQNHARGPANARRAAYTQASADVARVLQRLPIQAYETKEELEALPTHALKERLQKFGVDCKGCVERADLITALLESGGSSGSTCSVCFEDYESGNLLRVLPCAHRFHVHCIDQWLLTKAKKVPQASLACACPLCSRSMCQH